MTAFSASVGGGGEAVFLSRLFLLFLPSFLPRCGNPSRRSLLLDLLLLILFSSLLVCVSQWHPECHAGKEEEEEEKGGTDWRRRRRRETHVERKSEEEEQEGVAFSDDLRMREEESKVCPPGNTTPISTSLLP